MRKRFYIFSRFSETNRDLDPTPESHTFILCLVAETNLLFLFTFCNPIKNPTLQSTTKKHHYEPSIWIGMGRLFQIRFFFFFVWNREKTHTFRQPQPTQLLPYIWIGFFHNQIFSTFPPFWEQNRGGFFQTRINFQFPSFSEQRNREYRIGSQL